MKKMFGIICLFIFLTACAYARPSFIPKRIVQIRIGMSKSDVLKIMEVSPGIKVIQNTEYLVYETHWGDYLVRITDGKVDAYGQYYDKDKVPSFTLQQ